MNKHVLTLKKRVVIAFSLLVVLPVLALFIFQNAVTRNEAERQVINNAQLLADRYADQLDAHLRSAAFLFSQLTADTDMRQVLSDSERHMLSGETYLSLQRAEAKLNLLILSSGITVRSLCLTNCSGIIRQINQKRFVTLPSTLTEESWFQDALNARGALVWQTLSQAGGVEVFSASCAVYDRAATRIVGTLNIAYDAADLFEIGDELADQLFYVNASLDAAYLSPSAGKDLQALAALTRGKEDTQRMTASLSGIEYVVVRSQPRENGWAAVYAVPQSRLFSATRTTLIITLVILAACFTCMVFFLTRMYAKLLSPLESAMAFINENTGHTVSLRVNPHGYPELTALTRRVASLMESKQSAEESLIRVSHQKEMSNLKELQMQINPHFLYNTLNSIKILADTGRTEEVSKLIYNLVHLLNACMDRSGLFIPLSHEFETLRQYLSIQQTIYGDMIRFEIVPDELLNDCLVPNFILQPLVENALQHGLDQSKADNRVRVSSREENGTLLLTVEDNGMGIPEEKLKQILSDMNAETPGERIGIRSVHQRIRLSCGDRYGVSVRSIPGSGTVFDIRLPLTRAARPDSAQ